MNAEQTLQTIQEGRIIAILRGDFGDRVEEIAAAIFDGGIVALEITLNSPNAFESIRQLARQFSSRMAIGAGTVLTTQEVDAAAEAGARFIVSPNMNPAVIRRTKQLGLVSLPGCFTPTEIVNALESGADAVKLFPANSLGPGFLRALHGPFAQIRAVPTGGITPEAAGIYFEAGAWAVGIGSELLGKDALSAERLKQIAARAKEFVKAANFKP